LICFVLVFLNLFQRGFFGTLLDIVASVVTFKLMAVLKRPVLSRSEHADSCRVERFTAAGTGGRRGGGEGLPV
jgi:hypothetical protein